jgi:hypothetical protein
MSNEGNTNDQSGSGKNDPNRMNDAPKTGQQSQSPSPQSDKSTTQQGGSTQKTGQQSQGGSQKDGDGSRQQGSSEDAGQRTGLPK